MDWRPLKRFCEGPPQYGLNISADQYVGDGTRFIRTTDVTSTGTLNEAGNGVFVDREEVGPEYDLRDGDLLFSRSGTLGRCLLYRATGRPATFAGYLVRFRPLRPVSSRYLFYCAQSTFFHDAIASDSVSSTISNFNAERYASIRFPSWTERDQQAIANFLDSETARIDTLIARKSRLAVVTNERFIEMVRMRVTGGHLLPDPLQVESGDVRGGWRPVRLGRDLRFGSGTTPPAGDGRFYGPGTPWIVTGNLRDDEIVDVVGSVTEKALAEYSALRVHPSGSLVVAMYGATVGRLGILTFPAAVNQACSVVHSGSAVDLRFLFLYLLAHRGVLLERTVGAGQPNISQEILRSIRIAAPDRDSQVRIVRELFSLRHLARAVIVSLDHQVELLRERREALITAAVTGELKIPGVAA
jgi:type I restriction enzyme, S subunit